MVFSNSWWERRWAKPFRRRRGDECFPGWVDPTRRNVGMGVNSPNHVKYVYDLGKRDTYILINGNYRSEDIVLNRDPKGGGGRRPPLDFVRSRPIRYLISIYCIDFT